MTGKESYNKIMIFLSIFLLLMLCAGAVSASSDADSIKDCSDDTILKMVDENNTVSLEESAVGESEVSSGVDTADTSDGNLTDENKLMSTADADTASTPDVDDNLLMVDETNAVSLLGNTAKDDILSGVKPKILDVITPASITEGQDLVIKFKGEVAGLLYFMDGKNDLIATSSYGIYFRYDTANVYQEYTIKYKDYSTHLYDSSFLLLEVLYAAPDNPNFSQGSSYSQFIQVLKKQEPAPSKIMPIVTLDDLGYIDSYIEDIIVKAKANVPGRFEAMIGGYSAVTPENTYIPANTYTTLSVSGMGALTSKELKLNFIPKDTSKYSTVMIQKTLIRRSATHLYVDSVAGATYPGDVVLKLHADQDGRFEVNLKGQLVVSESTAANTQATVTVHNVPAGTHKVLIEFFPDDFQHYRTRFESDYTVTVDKATPTLTVDSVAVSLL